MAPQVLLCGEHSQTFRQSRWHGLIPCRASGNVNKNIVWSDKEVEAELAPVAEVLVSSAELVIFGAQWLILSYTHAALYQQVAQRVLLRPAGQVCQPRRHLPVSPRVPRRDLASPRSSRFPLRRAGSHNDSASAIGVFDAELIGKLPESVKYICHNGAGYDQIDVKAATARGGPGRVSLPARRSRPAVRF